MTSVLRIAVTWWLVCTGLIALPGRAHPSNDPLSTKITEEAPLRLQLKLDGHRSVNPREFRIEVSLDCLDWRCPWPRLRLNLTRSVGLYAWSEESWLQEVEPALCQFSGTVEVLDGSRLRGGDQAAAASFASLNLCRGPSGLIAVGSMQFLVSGNSQQTALNISYNWLATSGYRSRSRLGAAFERSGWVQLTRISVNHPAKDRGSFRAAGCAANEPPTAAQVRADTQTVRKDRARRSAVSPPVVPAAVINTSVAETVSRRFVEILFVVDSSIASFHRTILDDFVFGILGIAQGVFRDPQLEEDIELSLASIYHLSSEEEALVVGNVSEQIASEVLDSFNAWIRRLRHAKFGKTVSWDISVLLTRKFLFSYVEYNSQFIKDPVLGITTYRSLCEIRRNGIVLQEIGLQSGFSLAHELGHAFNMYHDNSPVCTRKLLPHETHGSFLMDSSLHPNTYPWTWSTCSKLHLREFLLASQSDCTRERSQPQVLQQPQQKMKRSAESPFYPQFTVDEQCKLLFGTDASLCETNFKPCGMLWCRLPGKPLCYSKKVVWAPRTPCGRNLICLDGDCVAEAHGTVAGGWSQWSEWTNCSAECGGGIRWRRRLCDNPRPRKGGSFCPGQRALAQSCGLQPCRDGATARDAQCAEFAKRRDPTQAAVALHPGLSSESRCSSLTCALLPNLPPIDGRSRTFTVDRVLDGTPCHPFDYGVCIGGVCKPAGCDGVLHSNLRWDSCGVCGGKNDSCHLQDNTFSVDIWFDAPYIHTFTQGSSDIELSTEDGTGSLCAIEIISYNDSDTLTHSLEPTDDASHPTAKLSSAALPPLIDTKQQQEVQRWAANPFALVVGRGRRELYLSGVWIQLSDPEPSVGIPDWRIKILGRLTSDLSVRVIQRPKAATNQRWESRSAQKVSLRTRVHAPNLRMRVASIGSCNRRCQGNQTLERVCEDTSGGEERARRLPESVCLGASPPIFIPPLPPALKCNTHCRYQWRVVPGNCSSRCGSGFAFDTYECVLRRDGFEDEILESEVIHCESRGSRLARRDCHGDCGPVEWRLGAWSACSATCGRDGVRSRQAICVDPRGIEWPSAECKFLILPGSLSEPCESPLACPTWRYNSWSSCDAYCGLGLQRRSVFCAWNNSISETAPPAMCPSTEMPASERNCTGMCHGTWQAGNWSECHSPCQSGRQVRQVTCVIGRKKVNALNCRLASKPTYSKDCSQQCVRWVYSHWGPCAESCGDTGSQKRLAFCINSTNRVIANEDCDKWIGGPTDVSRPCPGLAKCPELIAKKFVWRTSEWSNCSQSCGREGLRSRHVKCISMEASDAIDKLETVVVEAENCDVLEKPAAVEQCNRHIECPYWMFRPWSKCLTDCDQGIQLRIVNCIQGGQTVDQEFCEAKARPKDIQVCNSTVACAPTWTTGSWNECSQTCGDKAGVQTRAIACRNGFGEEAIGCPSELKPSESRRCGLGPCPQWLASNWSGCVGICGNGTRTRELHCRWNNGTPAAAGLCSSLAIAPVRESCRLETDCLWRVGPWSGCTAPCAILTSSDPKLQRLSGHRGHKHRTVECRLDVDGPVLPDALCAELRPRPRGRRGCRRVDEETLRACRQSAYGVSGGRSRTATFRREAASARQELLMLWRSGPWSTCSALCGRGHQTRRVAPCPPSATSATVTACSHKRPRSRRSCFVAFCPYAWLAGPWSACSATCGLGQVTRRVECQRVSPEGWRLGEAADASLCEPKTAPEAARACNLRECGVDSGTVAFWEVGEFSECHYFGGGGGEVGETDGGCGEGERRRNVTCRTSAGPEKAAVCPEEGAPPERDICPPRRCTAESCAELKRLARVKLDGEYDIRIDGRTVTVYCFGMRSRNPREFVSLSQAGHVKNFAIMHNIALARAPGVGKQQVSKCPSIAEQSRFNRVTCSRPGAPCRVVQDTESFVTGMSVFRKYRLLLTPRLMIDAADDTFAISWKSFVPAGQAGDCFSFLPNCALARFSIDLTGTTFAIDSSNEWIGENVTTKVITNLDPKRVHGTCGGGTCGRCKLPDDKFLVKIAPSVPVA